MVRDSTEPNATNALRTEQGIENLAKGLRIIIIIITVYRETKILIYASEEL